MSKYLSFLNQYANFTLNSKGISQEEIREIETDFNVRLPIAYKEYLMQFGSDSSRLLGSYLTEKSKLQQNKASALIASIDELSNTFVEIKPSYFFFAQWQGYNFFFFDCEEKNDNPQIYLLTDSPSIKKYKNSFTEFVLEEGIMPYI
jgi:SMI1-KNR4 cell-wall